MKKTLLRITAWAALLSLAQAMCAEGVPNGYYDDADGKKGKQLKVALGEIISNHTVLPYSSLWSHYEVTDVVPGTEKQVFDYYSPNVYYFPGNGAAPSGANKEHACPQSWWGGGKNSNCYSDLFNVMPSEEKANSAKSNYPLGTTSNATYNNGRTKVGNSNRSAYQGMVFEPADEFKGDFARIYFYVATCYANAAWGSKSSVASTCAFTQEDYPTIKSWLLDLLLQWNAADPVDEWEITRQERVFGEQQNRNPFIDYPQLADHIWGDKQSVAFDFASAILHGEASGNSGSNTDPEDPADPDDPSDPDEPGDHYEIGEELLYDAFDDITDGNDHSTGGSSKVWSGNDNFPTASNAFQAGGAVRMGSSKGIGSIISRHLGNVAGTTLVIEVSAKGWTNVEGDLIAVVDGCDEQSLSYEATMSSSYQTLRFEFEGCSSNATLMLKTSSKRIFIDSVRVNIGETSDAITTIRNDRQPMSPSYSLGGHRLANGALGLCIRDGRVCWFR